ncbi:MAG: hypothetical protein JXQ29_05085 [Planctomycetes bacterium]|nr:hypothetical protein [Planctomycetota bacterium]
MSDTRPSGAPPPAVPTPPPGYPSDGDERLEVVRYGKMHLKGIFRSRTPGLIYNEKVVIQTERGLEIGEVGFPPAAGANGAAAPEGWILRRAQPEDLARQQHLNDSGAPVAEYRFCAERIAALGVPMRLVDVERPFGGGKIIFYFTAEGRVDFRGLVRELAKRYRTRIEMKQIGVRDEAKVLGDIADCGRELCCRAFLTRLQPISMRMAKVQKTTLDPAKISGRCGRLKCCLRYEYEAYLSLRAALPRNGAVVRVGDRVATVVAADVLSQQVQVLLPEGERLTVHASCLRAEPGPSEAVPKASPGAAGPDVDVPEAGGEVALEESCFPPRPEAAAALTPPPDEATAPAAPAGPPEPKPDGSPRSEAGADRRGRRRGKRSGSRRDRRAASRRANSGAQQAPGAGGGAAPPGPPARQPGGVPRGRRRRGRGRGPRPPEAGREGGAGEPGGRGGQGGGPS